MEKERQQSITSNGEAGGEDSAHPPTNCKGTESEEDKAEEPKPETETEPILNSTMANLTFGTQCRTIESQQNLKLIVRSQYWGRELKGRTCRNVFTNKNNKAPLVITSQAVLYNSNNTDGFWGCCPNHGKRVLELQDYHFSDASEGCHWDLYLVGTWISPNSSIHDFFLLPQNQTSVDTDSNVRFNGWSYFGTCNADMIRSGIDELLRNLLLENDPYGPRRHHVHIDIMMDSAFDRETPRSRKINNEKARSERKKGTDSLPHIYDRQESSVTTESTASTEQESQPAPTTGSDNANNKSKSFATKVVGVASHVPRYVTNDSGSYLRPVPQSMASPMVNYQDTRWPGEATQWNQDQFSFPSQHGWIIGRSGHIANGGEPQGMQWYPGKGMPLSGGMSQPTSYWPHGHSPQYATAPPQSYYHSPDMQMHPYQVGLQHTQMASELQYYNMSPSENLYYNGGNTTPERPMGAGTSMIFREPHEGSNIQSLPYPLVNVSTSDRSASPPSHSEVVSSSPGMPSASPEVALLDTAKVSPIAAANVPSIVLNEHSGISPGSSPSHLESRETTSNPATTPEPPGIRTTSQLLIPTTEEEP